MSKHHWQPRRITRTTVARADAQVRWDQAYQCLLRCSQGAALTDQPPLDTSDTKEATYVTYANHTNHAHRMAIYARVSSQHQAQTGNIQQQLDRLRLHCEEQGWSWSSVQTFDDDGYSGSVLKRPGLERLRDQAAHASFDRVLITAPDRLARKYVHQVLLIAELQRGGCQVEFVERPMSEDPHDQLLLQIRGAVAEYERTLIAERMRRGRLQKYQASTLLP